MRIYILILFALTCYSLCTEQETELYLYRSLTDLQYEGHVVLYERTEQNATIVFNSYLLDTINYKDYYYLCISPQKKYQLALQPVFRESEHQQYVALSLNTGFPFFEDLYPLYQIKLFEFEAQPLVHQHSLWTYTMTPKSESDWFLPYFDTSDWSTGCLQEISTSSLTQILYITRICVLDDLIYSNGTLLISVLTRTGIVFYINGIVAFDNSESLFIPMTANTFTYISVNPYSYMIPDSKVLRMAFKILFTPQRPYTSHFDISIVLRVANDISSSIHVPLERTPIQENCKESSDIIETTLTYTFDNFYSTINGYVIYFSSITSISPTYFQLQASLDGTHWTILDSRESIEYLKTKEFTTFPIYGNLKPYRIYQLVYKSPSYCEYPIDHFDIVFSYGVPHVSQQLSYNRHVLYTIPVMQYVYLYPLLHYYKDFTSEGSLPKGLTISNRTGEIQGYVHISAEYKEYVILIQATNMITGAYKTSVVSIIVTNCHYPQVLFQIEVQRDMYSYGGFYYIQNNVTHEVLDYYHIQSATSPSKSPILFNYCETQGIYNLHFYNIYHGDWKDHTQIRINLSYRNQLYPIGSFTLNGDIYKDVSVSLQFAIHENEEWLVFYNDNVLNSISNTWYKNDFIPDSNWNVVTYNGIKAKGRIWLYRKEFIINSIVGFTGFEIRLMARAGLVIYLNEKLIFTSNINCSTGFISSSSVATGGESFYFDETTKSISGSISLLKLGRNILCIAKVPKESTFNATVSSVFITPYISLRLLQENNQMTRGIYVDEEVISTPYINYQYYFKRIFEGITPYYYKGLYNENYPHPYAVVYFNNNGGEYFNKYCLTCSPDIVLTDVYSIIIEGIQECKDSNWKQIDIQKDINFINRLQKKCFYIQDDNILPYNSLRFTILSIKGSMENTHYVSLSQIELLMDIQDYTDISLTYPSDSVTIYSHTYFRLYTTSMRIGIYSNFTVSPSLPEGMHINIADGTIYGIPTSYTNQSYIISANNIYGMKVNTSLFINIVDCLYPNLLITITIECMNDEDCSSYSYSLIESGSRKVDEVNEFYYDMHYTKTICVIQSLYSLYLADKTFKGWKKATITLQEYNKVLFNGVATNVRLPNVIPLSLRYLIHSTYQNYIYIPSVTEDIIDWKEIEYIPTSDWKDHKGSFTSLEGNVQYLRTTFHIESIENSIIWYLEFTTTQGFVIYINGKELYRYNMPEGKITKDTFAINRFDVAQSISTSSMFEDGVLLEHQDHVVCIELHSSKDPSLSKSFSILLKRYFAKQIQNEGTIYSNHITPGVIENLSYLFDNNMTTNVFIKAICHEHTIDYIFNHNETHYVNSIYIYPGNENYKPKNINIYGTTNYIDWELLYSNKDITWGPSIYGERSINNYYINQTYKGYRFGFNGCLLNGLELTQIQLWFANYNSYCNASNGYSITSPNMFAFKDCPLYYSGYMKRYCYGYIWGPEVNHCTALSPLSLQYGDIIQHNIYIFENIKLIPRIEGVEVHYKINPPLPDGLSLDSDTGIISGSVRTKYSISLYNVTATNSQGSISTKILFVFEYNYNKYLSILFIITLIIFIILLSIYICLTCKQKHILHGKINNNRNSSIDEVELIQYKELK
ncbi:hypothetical protein WA158_001565 [Blastocystis sp. Blastoise]